ncbi:MAG TPA: DUF1579 family protein [Polyangiaceae bacterium]|nr:DUF1579 family protein [Polyangiaceae bacterium]
MLRRLAPPLAAAMSLACARPSAPPVVTPPQAVAASVPAPPPAPPRCGEPERHQLDFWLGDWDLVVRAPQKDSAAPWSEARGISAIRLAVGGCSVEENFHAEGPGTPWAGRSFSTYRPATHTWRQTWVDDSGGYLPFHGGPEGSGFVLYGEEANPMRMVFKDVTAGSLLWSWEKRTETGWTPVLTIAYTRRPAAPTAR